MEVDIKEEKVCRICLTEIKGDYQLIDDTFKESFKILNLNMNLEVTEEPIICDNCADQVQKLVDFKTACLEKDPMKVNDANAVPPNHKMCCCCKEFHEESTLVSLEKLKKDFGEEVFRKFLPEIIPLEESESKDDIAVTITENQIEDPTKIEIKMEADEIEPETPELV